MKRRLHGLYVLTERLKNRMSARFTPLGKVFLLLAALTLLFGINVERTMIYHIFSLTLMLLAFSFVLSLRFSPSLRIRRFLPATCVAGREIRYRVRLENTGTGSLRGVYFREAIPARLPDWHEFDAAREEKEERRNMSDRLMGYYRWLWLVEIGRKILPVEQPLPNLPVAATQEIEATLLPLRRGAVHLPGAVLGRVDPFGLCRREVLHDDECNLLVLPRIYAVPQLLFRGGRKYHRGGITAAREQGDSGDFLSLREYVHGDPIKHMDWKATARSGRPIVKQFRDEFFSRYGLVLDSFTEKKYSSVFEEAVSLAASVMLAQDSFNAVLDLLFVENECVTCTVGGGIDGQQRMMEILAAVSTCGDKPFSELAALVRSHAALLSGVVVIYIDLDSERRDLLEYLHIRNIPLKAVLLVEDDETMAREKKKHHDLPLQIFKAGEVEAKIGSL